MKQSFIIGGYTKRLNTGLHEILFNANTHKIEKKDLISSISNPTYLCTNNDRTLLFSIIQDTDSAGVIAYKKVESQWQEVSRMFASKINGCHIQYFEDTQSLYVSNYHEGLIDVYHFINDQLDHIQRLHHTDQSKIHFTDIVADKSLLYACDLGTDTIISYRIQKDGTLSKYADYKTHDEMGPRHFIIHPKQSKMYAIGEYDNHVTIFDIDHDGHLTEKESLATIPNDYMDGASGAAIKITKDGQYLYTSTRFSNYLSVFKVLNNGQLERVQYIDSVGQIPRDFALSEDENHILVPHQDSDFISIFQRNSKTGELTFLNNDFEMPEAVCIL